MLSSFITLHEGKVIARFLKERFHGRSILAAPQRDCIPGIIDACVLLCASTMLSLPSSTTNSAISVMVYALHKFIYSFSPLVILGHTQLILVHEWPNDHSQPRASIAIRFCPNHQHCLLLDTQSTLLQKFEMQVMHETWVTKCTFTMQSQN